MIIQGKNTNSTIYAPATKCKSLKPTAQPVAQLEQLFSSCVHGPQMFVSIKF